MQEKYSLQNGNEGFGHLANVLLFEMFRHFGLPEKMSSI